MHRIFILALCAATALAQPAVAQAATLADSVSRALETHPSIAEKKAVVDAASDNVSEQRSVFFPVLGVNGRFGALRENDNFTRASSGGFVNSWQGEGDVALNQPVFAGFANVNHLKAAKDREQSARYDLNGSADDLALKAARAHLNLMRTRDLLDVASKYMDAIQGRKDSIALMVKEGAGDTAEQLQSEEVLMAAKTSRLGYEEGYRQAEADYISIVGMHPDQNLEFGAPGWDRMIPPTLDEAITQAVHDNPMVKSADSVVSALAREAEADRATFIPRVDAELSASDMDQKEELSGERKNLQGMLKMSWNFATGGGQFAHISKDMNARKEAAAKRDGARRTVEHDVRQKFTSMQIVDQQLGLMQDREKADEQILSNLTSQFEGGKQSNLQLINANARLFDAQAGRIDAYYRRLLSRFELLNAMGRLRDAFSRPGLVIKPGAPDGR